jgi:hypothetical protein
VLKKALLYCIILLLNQGVYGQMPFAYLGDNFQLRINSDGSFAIDKSNLAPSFYNSENHNFLNQGGLWISAEDNAEQIFTAVHHFKGQDSSDFWPGPIDTLTGQTDPVTYWNKAWPISKEIILNHRSNYASEGYVVPRELANWPANSANGFANYLAPFADVNRNQKYDPENGDFPYIRGDQAVYVISNDVASEHTASFGLEIGIEIHLLAYTFNTNPEAVYFDTYLISRKNKFYKNVKVGLFLGGECGNPNDNFGATLVDQNSVIIFNGDNEDEGYFGNNLPYTYGQLLNHKLDQSLFFNNQRNTFNGLPTSSQEYTNYLNNKWLDGTPRTYGGNGKGGEINYAYLYPGNSDLSVNEWSENSANNNPGPRNGLAISSQKNLTRGDYIHFEFAIGASTTSNNDNIITEVENKLKNNLVLFKATSSNNNTAILDQISIKPNPTQGQFFINFSPPYDIEIHSNQGVIVYSEKNIKNAKHPCNVQLASGVYQLKLIKDNQIINKPIIVNH